MSFSSLPFLFVFFPIFFILYYLLPARVKTAWLLLGSLIFYYWGCREAPWQLGLICIMVLVNFCLGHVIGRSSHPKPWLVVGLLFNFLPLVWFKYFAFFGNTLLSLLTLPAVLETKSLPLGLSFFAFQAAAYLVDVYRRSVLPERSLIRAGAYFLLFPHVGSGPILDYRDTAPQLINPTVRLYMVDRGLREFCIGLSLKLLLADRVGKLWQDVAAIGYESISTPLAWMALFAYTFELYLDFYGYSRMAVGLGWMLGLELPRNFSYPYAASSLTEFWRRWHISLSMWFRNYLYIPLGGSRNGTAKTVRNLLIVWLATGLWHGASFNFLLWGLAVFLLLLVEKAGLKKLFDRVPVLGHLYLAAAVPLTWLIFGISDLSKLGVYFSRLFPFHSSPMGAYALDYLKYARQYGVLLVLCAIFSTPLPRRIYRKFASSIWMILLLLAAFWVCLYCIRQGLNDPFLYFQF